MKRQIENVNDEEPEPKIVLKKPMKLEHNVEKKIVETLQELKGRAKISELYKKVGDVIFNKNGSEFAPIENLVVKGIIEVI